MSKTDQSTFKARVTTSLDLRTMEKGFTVMIQKAKGMKYNMPVTIDGKTVFFTTQRQEANEKCKELNQYFKSLQ